MDDEEISYHDFLPTQGNPEKQALSRELGEVIAKALKGMSSKYRDVFVLAVFHKMSYEEISNIVDRSLLFG